VKEEEDERRSGGWRKGREVEAGVLRSQRLLPQCVVVLSSILMVLFTRRVVRGGVERR